MPEDSGWQFLCDTGEDEDSERARVWLVCEVTDYEPSLLPFIGFPPGTVLRRRSREADWEVGRKSGVLGTPDSTG